MRRTLLATGLLAAMGTGALAASSELRARTWTPLVTLAAGRGPEAPKVAAERLRNGLETIRTLLHGLDADDPTRAFFVKVLEQLESFDLAELYETLPDAEDGGYRAVRFTGRSQGGKYEIRRAGPTEAICDPDGALGGKFGDLGLAFRSKKAPGENDNYVGDIRLGLGLGSSSWLQVVASVAETIRLVESTGPGLPRASVRPSPQTLAEVKKDNPRCGPEDLEILAMFRESFPKFYEHLRQLYRTEDVLVFDPEGEGAYQQIRLVLAFRKDTADKTHPGVHAWLTGLGPLATGRLDLCDSQGRPLATLRFSTKDLAITIDAFASKGKLCPVERGIVLVGQGTDLESVAEAHKRDRWTLDFDVNGITTEIRELDFKVDYQFGQEGMKARMTFDAMPKVKVRGSAFGVIPTWAIDVVMPGNMQELTEEFLRTVARGNGGKGMVLEATARTGKNGATVFDLGAEAEGLNNFLVRLGFKIARRKIIPSDQAIDELASFLREGQAALAADVESFASDQK